MPGICRRHERKDYKVLPEFLRDWWTLKILITRWLSPFTDFTSEQQREVQQSVKQSQIPVLFHSGASLELRNQLRRLLHCNLHLANAKSNLLRLTCMSWEPTFCVRIIFTWINLSNPISEDRRHLIPRAEQLVRNVCWRSFLLNDFYGINRLLWKKSGKVTFKSDNF